MTEQRMTEQQVAEQGLTDQPGIGQAAMRAVVQRAYGGPEVVHLAEVPTPVPADDEVLVAVRAAGVHAGDVRIMRGEPLLIRVFFGRRRPRQPVIGRDIVGDVVAIGQSVRDIRVGDRVFAECDQAGFAEYVAIAAQHVRSAPANLDDEHVAAMPVSGMTALQGLRLGGLRVGEAASGARADGVRVLVIGASGGVGTYAVQLATAAGAEVTGVCSAAKAEHVLAAGAVRVIDRQGPVVEPGADYDLILDLAGAHPLRALRSMLAPRGTLVLAAGSGSRVFGPIGRILAGSMQSLFTRQQLKPLAARRNGADLDELRRLAEAGVLRPVVDRVLPLAEASAALALLESGAVRGKVVLRVSNPVPNSASSSVPTSAH